jgi:hypothetical protein
MKYCCEKKCFEVWGDQVDGLACKICMCYGYCLCKCIKYINDITIKQILATYHDWKYEDIISKKTLSECGFLYTGDGDAVMCFKCGITLRSWEKIDDPKIEHDKHATKKKCYLSLKP